MNDGRTELDNWTAFYAFNANESIHAVPLIIRRGEEPPGKINRHGLQLDRLHYSAFHHWVAYATPWAQEDLRTMMRLLGGMNNGDA